MYNKLVAELVMGRDGYGPSLYGPSWLWAEFVMGRVCYGPRCPVTFLSLYSHTRISVASFVDSRVSLKGGNLYKTSLKI